MNYERLLSYGNIFPLQLYCEPSVILKDIRNFKFSDYNPSKPNNRKGLSITSLDGKVNGIDLDSLRDLPHDEGDFRCTTDVYHQSRELYRALKPYKPWLCRSHFINMRKGGYFPPHRDEFTEKQEYFRIIIPISFFNPPDHYFIYDDKILNLNLGRGYFMNTNVCHSLFSYSDEAMFIVLNIESCEDSHKTIIKNLLSA